MLSRAKWLGSIFLIGFMTFAVGCNGGSDSGDDSSGSGGDPIITPASPQIYAEDIFVNIIQDNDVLIPIEQRAFRSDSKPVQLDDVKLVDSNNLYCNDVSFTNDEIHVSSRTSGVCVYEYSVSAVTPSSGLSATHSDSSRADETEANTKVSAHAYIVVQPKNVALRSSSPLPTISMVAGSADLVIDIEDKLGSSFPTGATVDIAVTVLGSGVASVDTTDKTITFSGGSTGVTRLIYSLTETDASVHLGVIDISISTPGANSNPVFTDFEFNGTISINLEQSELTGTIDIAPYISDPDNGQSPQIIDYRGFNISLTASASDPSSLTKFDFKVKLSGVYYVSVTISDHHGGYTTGLVEINAKNMFAPITVNNMMFLPPISFVEAQYSGFAYIGSYKETTATGPKDFEMALMTYDIADAICKSKGGLLPTSEQMAAFIEQEKTDKLWGASKKQWPIGKPYFTQSSGDNVGMVTFSSGPPAMSTETSVQNALGYVSCVDMTPLSLSIDNDRIYIDVTDTLTASFETSFGLKYPYEKPLTWSITSGTEYVTLEDINQVTGVSKGTSNVKTVNYTNDLSATKAIPVTGQPVLITDVMNGTVNENVKFTSTTPTANQLVTWSVTGNDATLVTINTSTGVVSMVARNYEQPQDKNADNVYSINVAATAISGSESASKPMMITVKNIVETSTIDLNNIKDESVNEGIAFTSEKPTTSGNIGKVTWTVGGSDATHVKINRSTGVVTMVARDYENPVDYKGDNTYYIKLIATDADGNVGGKFMTITVKDVKERSTITLDNIKDESVDEGMAFTSATPTASGNIGNVTWTVGGSDATHVKINRSTGVVTMVARDYENPVDYKGDNTYNIKLIATDADGNVGHKVMTITVKDVIERSTITLGNIKDESVDEGTAFISEIPTASGNIGNVTWTVSGNDANHVTINRSTGVVTMVARDYDNPVDDGKNNTYYIQLKATDADGNVGSKSMTITVQQLDDNFYTVWRSYYTPVNWLDYCNRVKGDTTRNFAEPTLSQLRNSPPPNYLLQKYFDNYPAPIMALDDVANNKVYYYPMNSYTLRTTSRNTSTKMTLLCKYSYK
ncbi:cadherin repeat domain-containing protein [Vibrio sp. DW001]|uniref:cadherin repeat domain-containing protein n=1 Tax=Vibrio sp. DW001 TaxID=2912315 RepID=UPI0023B12AA6|nr:hypothetical protein [Vibrio sp. DW001]WED27543.1 cadherin repeat domain-containing protein [Vibrio sp. DW001]